MNKQPHLIGVALIACVAGQSLLVQDAEACKCKPSRSKVQGIYPTKGTLPANAKGITVVATKWPRNSRIVSIPSQDIQLTRKRGKKTQRLAFEVQYLGPIQTNFSESQTLKKINRPNKKAKFSVKQRQYMTQMQQGIYLIVPKGGLKRGATYQLTLAAGPQYYRTGRKNRNSKKTGAFRRKGQRYRSATITVGRTKLRTPKQPKKPKITFINKKIRTPAGSRCSLTRRADGTAIKMKVPRAYKDAMIYAVFVNGKLWRPKASWCSTLKPGRSANAPLGEEFVYMTYQNCAPKTKIEAVAMLPGTDLVWWFKPTFINMSCGRRK